MTGSREAVTLSRDVEAAAIPYGDKIPLAAGTTVYITQALGGSYTVMTDRGYMVRIEGKDADAIGQPVVAAPSPDAVAGDRPLQDLAWDQLKTCYDPEIPVNIVDLGLVYRCEVAPRPEGGDKVTVHFTLTAPGCGMGDYLKQDVEHKIKGLPGVQETDVQVVFDPPWEQSMMSEAARLQLGLM
jgi:probable FeS assembly SUF system protein SufT